MPLSVEARVAVRLRRIKDVAEDLSRELLRVQCPSTSALHDMAVFIKAEADTALTALKKSRR
jgi:phosphate uptake regulator